MRNLKFYFIILLLIFSYSCIDEMGNENENSIDVCYSKLINSPDSVIISENDYNTAINLLTNNNIDFSNLQILRLTDSSSGKCVVYCYQFINNLRVFTNCLGFFFDTDGSFLGLITGEFVDKIRLDTIPSLNDEIVIEKYLIEFENDSTFLHDKNELLEKCLLVEFGYYDLNYGTPMREFHFIKAWKIRPTNQKYPAMYVNDNNSNILGYFTGTIIE